MNPAIQQTLRLEPTLRQLAKNPTYGLKWLARRNDIPEEDLRAWLLEHNGGGKELREARIDEVKRQLGTIKVHEAGEIPDDPDFHVQEAPAAEPATPQPAPAAAPTPEIEPASHRKVYNASAYIAVCRALLVSGGHETAACKAAGVKQSSWANYKAKHFGKGHIDREKLAEHIAAQTEAGREPNGTTAAGKNQLLDELVKLIGRAGQIEGNGFRVTITVEPIQRPA
jgi:hypothetical protein